ncbi:hypothetical protein FRC04_002000 [Tulasnella sp. 424]|nr:hypothetical protein FRC04_002000 [Tulasnella sp. 424]KAG8968038.1 hypothetical protein FRC05_001671 [Tulasnella sp. 425]
MESNGGTTSQGYASNDLDDDRSRTIFVSDLSPLLFGTPPLVFADQHQTNLRRLFSIFGPIDAITPIACRPDDSSPEPDEISQVPPGLAESPVSMDVDTNHQVRQYPVPPPAAPTRYRPPERVIFAATVSYIHADSAELAQESLNGLEIGGNHMSASLVQNPIHIPDILTAPDLSHTGQPDPPFVAGSPSPPQNAPFHYDGVDMLESGPWNGATDQRLNGSSTAAGIATHSESATNNLLLPLTTFQPLPSPGAESGGSGSSSYVSLQHPLPLYQPQPIRAPTVDPAIQRLERQIEVLRRAVQNRGSIPALEHASDFGPGHRRRPTPLIADAFRNSMIIARRNTSTGDNATMDTMTNVSSDPNPDVDGQRMEIEEEDVWARRGLPPEFR